MSEEEQPEPPKRQKAFDLLASVAVFARRNGIALDNPTLIHSSRVERVFEATVLSLGGFKLLKTEDVGRVHAAETLRAPDFRIVLDDGEQWLVEVKNVRSREPFKQELRMSQKYLSPRRPCRSSQLIPTSFINRTRHYMPNTQIRLTPHRIKLYCQTRLAPVMSQEDLEKIRAYLEQCLALRKFPPYRGRSINIALIANETGIHPDRFRSAQRYLQPICDALCRAFANRPSKSARKRTEHSLPIPDQKSEEPTTPSPLKTSSLPANQHKKRGPKPEETVPIPSHSGSSGTTPMTWLKHCSSISTAMVKASTAWRRQ